VRPDDADMNDIRLVVQTGKPFGRFTPENVGEYLLEELDNNLITDKHGWAVGQSDFDELQANLESQKLFFDGMQTILELMRISPPFMFVMLGEDSELRGDLLTVVIHVDRLVCYLVDIVDEMRLESQKRARREAEEARLEAKRRAEDPWVEAVFPE
jgi:hypothetical protein